MPNPMIALSGRLPQIENPLNQFAKSMQVQSGQTEQMVNLLKLQDIQTGRQETNALARVLEDPQYVNGGRFDYTAATPAIYKAAPTKGMGVIKGLAEQRKAELDAGKTEAEMNEHQWKLLGSMTNVVAADPRPQTVGALLSQWEGLTGRKADAVRSAFAQHGDNADGIREMALRMNLQAKEQLYGFETRNTGGSTDTIRRDPVRGTAEVVNSAQNTASPADIMRQRVEQARLAEQQRHNRSMESFRGAEVGTQREAARTEIKETADGWVAIDKGTKQVIQLKGPDGRPLGPKLKEAPPAVQQAVLSNAQNLARAERALALVQGINVGDPANGGQRGDKEATGWKGYLPNTLLNRIDDSGVDARAAIADLGSLVIHDRSGAAVTAAEFPRLAPFIPQATDDAATVQKKLQRFVQVYREENAGLHQAFNPDTGYRSPGGRVAGSTAPSAPSREAQKLPANPTAATLQAGEVYQLPNGKSGRWNGQAFEVVQ